MTERIAGPALRTEDGEVWWLAAPKRHHDVMGYMGRRELSREEVIGSAQGFWTTERRYVSREEAWEIAAAAGQIKQPELARRPRELFTECMW